ncbi:E3 ubiquitin-protein ligase LNX-like [Tachypleus tridentatus]|uniref:E3 ubiquitin-protein ligase LNX-like n=1 Tax=Tachypleus tridentatus TaxID=6853 RepID=UPI003FD6767D
MSLRDISFKEAVKLLREAASPVRLLVVRENPQTLFTTHQMLTSSDIPRKFIMVELRKTSVKDKLGMSFIQRTNGRGVFITYVQPGSIAAQHGQRIMQGDEILEVNGQNVRDRNQKDMAELLLVVRHGCGHPALFRSVAVDSFCGPRGLAAISGY